MIPQRNISMISNMLVIAGGRRIPEAVIEKLLALSDRARNEPRDLYDFWYLFDSSDLRITEMRSELDAKLTLPCFHVQQEGGNFLLIGE